jgi:hypothetical protein
MTNLYRVFPIVTTALALTCSVFASEPIATESDFYRIVTIATSKAPTDSRAKIWKPPPQELALEVSGLAVLDDDRLAVSIRKGEVWFLDGVYDDPPNKVTYHRFASALHEPLGLLKKGDSFYTVQRSELTQLRDSDGDHIADEYLTVAKGWGTTGNYHEYAYGPKLDRDGNFWLTLNIGMGIKGAQRERLVTDPILGFSQARWRGWGMKVTPAGQLVPVCAGMRSPCGLGANRDGDMFYTDQQGNWVATNSLHHMREGAFFHHPEALASMTQPGSPITGIKEVPNGLPFPEALKKLPQLKPPAVWFPYKKVGQSATDIMLDNSGGKFGPFDGQLFIGEFTLSSINRVFLEKVGGEYQGACFPFREGFGSGSLSVEFAPDGSLFVGGTNRGWGSRGNKPFALDRVRWSGKVPFEIHEMRAKPDGFELTFTEPVDAKSAGNPESYSLGTYAYIYQAAYGSPEVDHTTATIDRVEVAADSKSVRLFVTGLQPGHVHELHATGVRSSKGQPLLHREAYYTLNFIPAK